MIFERIGIFIIKVRDLGTKLRYTGGKAINSQLAQIFFSSILIILTVLLFSIWSISGSKYPLVLKIIFTVIYFFAISVYSTGLYFFLSKKHIRNVDGKLTVEHLERNSISNSDFGAIQAIALTDEQIKNLFNSFSGNFLSGNIQSFRRLIHLKTVEAGDRLEWIDGIPKNPKQVNRQTLLEFLSQLFQGFENLNNHQIIFFVEHYFTLKDPVGTQQILSTKNISDWRMNKAAYLKEISRLFQHHL